MKIIKEHSVTQDNYYDDTIYITNSMLSKLSEKSPAHFKYWLDNKPEPTAAMQLGSAIHSAILTPLEFTKNYVVAPDIDKRTKAGKEAWAKFVEENTKTIITYKDKQMIKELYYSFYSDSYIKKLFSKGEPEQIVCFYDEISKLKCKSMIDYLRNDGIIIDLKTTTDASNNFSHSINRYKYHKQAAFYMDAVGANRFFIVAVEKTRPYALNVFELSKETIQEGRELYRDELNMMSQCMEKDYWPSYGHKFLGSLCHEKQVTIL
jgi:exodeoxyribonuclease VIII